MDVARVRAALVADLEELAGLALRHHHAAGAVERVRHLLLAVHVLAGFQAVNRVLRVPEVGRGDDDRVELFLLVEHLAVVFVAVGLLLEPLEGVDDAPLVVFSPDVAHRTEAQARDAEHRLHQHLALCASADQRDVDRLEVGRGGRCRGGGLRLFPLVLALFVPRVAEEPGRRDRGEAHQHVAAIEFRRPHGRARLLAFGLVVFASHRWSPTNRPAEKYTPLSELKLGPTDCPNWSSGLRIARTEVRACGPEVAQFRLAGLLALWHDPRLEAGSLPRRRPRFHRRSAS